jgi:hypothetical protein
MPVDYLLASALLVLIQVAMYLMAGQAVLYVLAGSRREQNWIYQLFRRGTAWLVKATRVITPRFVLDRHVPFLTFLLLVVAGLAVVNWKRIVCLSHQLNCPGLTT